MQVYDVYTHTLLYSVALFVVGGIGCYRIEPCDFNWNYSTGHTLHQPQNVMVIEEREGKCIIHIYFDVST